MLSQLSYSPVFPAQDSVWTVLIGPLADAQEDLSAGSDLRKAGDRAGGALRATALRRVGGGGPGQS
jgi:hypothetical protein